MYRIDIISTPCDDHKGLTQMQQKINTWITTGSLKKYDIHTTATHIIFNVCRTKEKGE